RPLRAWPCVLTRRASRHFSAKEASACRLASLTMKQASEAASATLRARSVGNPVFFTMLLKGNSIRVPTSVVSIQGCGCGKESPLRLIFFALVTGALSGQALAADLSVPPPPRASVAFVPPPPVFTWSGIYIGGNG